MKMSVNAQESNVVKFTRPGYILLYRDEAENVCPGCGKRHWIIGRTTAECAFCDTALPLMRNVDGGNARRFTVSAQHGVAA